jgi:hypothetical protein
VLDLLLNVLNHETYELPKNGASRQLLSRCFASPQVTPPKSETALTEPDQSSHAIFADLGHPDRSGNIISDLV